MRLFVATSHHLFFCTVGTVERGFAQCVVQLVMKMIKMMMMIRFLCLGTINPMLMDGSFFLLPSLTD